MKIEADYNFLKSWNTAFSTSMNLILEEDIFIKKYHIFKSYLLLGAWHPVLFSSSFNDNFEKESYSILKKHNKVYGLTCIPLKNISAKKKAKLLNDNLTIHYIDIRGKSLNELFLKFKPKVRREIRSGSKKFNFLKLNYYEEFLDKKEEIRNMLLNQHSFFCSPSPPIELLENLFLEDVLDIYIAIYNNKTVAFSSISKDKNIVQVAWSAKKINFKDHDLGIAFNFFCLEEAIKRGVKIFSLGTSSRDSLAKFKEKLNSEKALLIKRRLNYKFPSKNLQYIKSNRNKINLTLMKTIIRMIIKFFGQKTFEITSKEIWKRFD